VIAVLQRVRRGRVTVAGRVVGEVGVGFVVLLGVARGDDEVQGDRIARKIQVLRVFEDDAGRMNRALEEVGGGVLLVPQFTLLAGLRTGRRPDFLAAAPPEQGERLWRDVGRRLEALGLPVSYGEFGADMLVEIENEGPATFLLHSEELR
jgi:D-tyrosyl-tRNA(Tyr) deacylase